MQVILPDEQIHQLQLLISQLIAVSYTHLTLPTIA